MSFNSQIARSDASAFIPEEAFPEIFKAAIAESAVLSMARRLPNMQRAQQRIPVLDVLPSASFINGDQMLKPTTNAQWVNKYINAEEVAVIVPIREDLLDDSAFDIWGEVRPLLGEAFGRVIDAAVLFGDGAPASWPTDILASAVSAGNAVTAGSGDDLYDDLLGGDDVISGGGVIARVETDGYFVTGHIGAMVMRGRLRGVRDSEGQPIFRAGVSQGDAATGSRYELDGTPIMFPRNGSFDASQALLFSGDWNQIVYSIRQDMTFKILDQAVIQDAAGNIVFNLAQQDMVALRAVMRLGWQAPNPVNPLQETEANRFPIAALLPAS